ncbi:MAG: DNA-binding transcriptional repressor FabR [Firmicutes bacterium ADurb.Bin182]|nr:MAG: DNA-binding transcriptional repressor FabR [Firmicutes bacterium ADurb.Bin182]
MSEKASYTKEKLKRQRTGTYFLEAAKTIIIAEGVESVSVRRVADAAGYSYPTLYNYFKDLNELLWETRQYMIREMTMEMPQKMDFAVEDKEGIKKVFKTYIEYYLENPNIFKFFYFHHLIDPGKKPEKANEEPDFGAMWNEVFKCFVSSGKLRERDVEAAAKTLIYAIHGMLTLSFSGNGDLGEEGNLFRDLNMIIDYIL